MLFIRLDTTLAEFSLIDSSLGSSRSSHNNHCGKALGKVKEQRVPGINIPRDLQTNLKKLPQGKSVSESQFTRKFAARAVESDNCLSAARAKDSREYETVLFVPVTPGEHLQLHSTLMSRREVQTGVSAVKSMRVSASSPS